MSEKPIGGCVSPPSGDAGVLGSGAGNSDRMDTSGRADRPAPDGSEWHDWGEEDKAMMGVHPRGPGDIVMTERPLDDRDRPPAPEVLSEEEFSRVLSEALTEAHGMDPETAYSPVAWVTPLLRDYRALRRERDEALEHNERLMDAVHELNSFDVPVELQKERAKVRKLRAERDRLLEAARAALKKATAPIPMPSDPEMCIERYDERLEEVADLLSTALRALVEEHPE